MRLRFWEPAPQPATGPRSSGNEYVLEARQLNYSDLAVFLDDMAAAVGADHTEIKKARPAAGGHYELEPIDLDGLTDLSPEQRRMVQVTASVVWPEGGVAGPATYVNLHLGDGLSTPATISGSQIEIAARLATRWKQLGTPRRTYEWIYPAGFLAALALCVASLVALWLDGGRSLWAIPPVIGLIAGAFTLVSPLLQQRVVQHRAARAGLEIDPQLLREARREKAVRRQNFRSGLYGALGGAVIGVVGTLIGVWIQVTNQK